MFRRIILVVALCAAVAVGTVAYMVLKPTAGTSQPIAAIPVEVASPTSPAVVETEVETPSATVEQPAFVTDAVAESVTQPAAAGQDAQASAPIVFEIIPDESEARFIIDEVLNGAPKTVVGATNQVAGQIAVNPSTAADSQVGVIQINARTLATDSDMRNRTIRNRILFTDDYEYITFAPTGLAGMPETINVGESVSFELTGDLTVRDVTLPVTFSAQVTPVSESRLEGSASTTIRYADFGITVPQVPSVTGLADEVVLEIDFAAEPV